MSTIELPANAASAASILEYHRKEGRFGTAALAAKKWLESHGDNLDIVEILCRCCIDSGDADEADKLITKIYETWPDKILPWEKKEAVAAVHSLSENKKYGIAILAARKWLGQYNKVEMAIELCGFYIDAGYDEKARDVIKKIRENWPEREDVLNFCIRKEFLLDPFSHPDEKGEYIDSIRRGGLKAILRRIDEKGDYPRSIQYLKKFITTFGEDAELLEMLAFSYEKTKQLPLAVETINKACTLCPDKQKYKLTRAVMKLRSGDYQDGINELVELAEKKNISALGVLYLLAQKGISAETYKRLYSTALSEKWLKVDIASRMRLNDPPAELIDENAIKQAIEQVLQEMNEIRERKSRSRAAGDQTERS
jgi:tetratricopeptide (TPR) repeat protein